MAEGEQALTKRHPLRSLTRDDASLSHPPSTLVPMARQLDLLPPVEPDWRIDDEYREAGRRGIAKARAALEAARSRSEREQHRTAA